MTDIYLIRHGESMGNLTRRMHGWYDALISPRGEDQIKCLGERFLNIEINAVYASDLYRAVKTAESIAAPKNLTINKDPRLRELSLGTWEDTPWGEAAVHRAEMYKKWVDAPLEFLAEGGEDYRTVYARVKSAIDDIARENEGKAVAIISHGTALRALIYGITNNGELSGIEKADWGDNTCVSRFTYKDGEYTPVFINDNSHLSSLPHFGKNMRWVKDGTGIGNNLYYTAAHLPEDGEKLREYYRAAWKEIFGEDIKDIRDVDCMVKRMLKKDSQSVVFAHGAAGEAGCVAYDVSAHLYPSTGHISFIYLKPEFRRRAYGIQLVGHAISRYLALGKKRISVRVAENNEAALAFYKKYGFYEAYSETESGIRQLIMIKDITA